MKVVIVGGVAGGASAAARLRRIDENAEIVMFERLGYVSYANCGLPYYIGGIITDEEKLSLQNPQSFWERFRIKVNVHHDVQKINPERKTVTVCNLDTCEIFEESYDKLILAVGAKPVIPDMPGIEDERIFTLRSVEDTKRIKSYLDTVQPKSAVVIGGGFIGLEMAENLKKRGLAVSIIEFADHLLAPFDYDMASILHAHLRKHDIQLYLKTAVSGFEKIEGGIAVKSADGKTFDTEMVLLSIGVVPDTALAMSAGLKMGMKGSILVNDRMETSISDIYAVGDAVEVKHFVTNTQGLIALAGPANKQGRIAANNICGMNHEYKGSQGSSILKLFDLSAASTGINESAARASGIDYDKVVLTPDSHATYYPNAQMMTMKVLYEKKTLRLLGAQIMGNEGVDKRIDVIATAIRAGMKATDLAELDLAYAPPYSSAKDPVNMAGFMIENIELGLVKQFHWDEVEKLKQLDVTLLDVRNQEEYEAGHIMGFINIPLDELRERISELSVDKAVYVMCLSGQRSYLACRILRQHGYDCFNLSGGYQFYHMQ